jgi:hypothetical protein
MTSKLWAKARYTVHHSDKNTAEITVQGRDRWALECLIKAGALGCTPIDQPGPRWSAYVHALRHERGLAIETIHEKHGGPFQGNHARYVLKSHVTLARGVLE